MQIKVRILRYCKIFRIKLQFVLLILLREKMATAEYKTPLLIRFIQDYVSPLNVLYAIQVPLAGLLDVLSPYAPLLFIASIISFLSVLYHVLTFRRSHDGNKIRKTVWAVFSVFCLIVFSSGALANYSHRSDGGALAHWIPKIKTWQDAYLVGIKKDTEEINAKLDKNNQMLASLLDNMKPELEKPLIEEIKGYKDLPDNQKTALMLFTKKVGTNGIRKYKGLIAAANQYTANKTPENAKILANHFNYIARVDGKDVADEKSKKLLMAMFLDMPTYNFMLGNGVVPTNLALLNQWGIDPSKPVDTQVADPLGDLIKQLEAKDGTIPEQSVVIPVNESNGVVDLDNIPASSPVATTTAPVKKHSQHKKGNYAFGWAL
jgi:hypothetical protein